MVVHVRAKKWHRVWDPAAGRLTRAAQQKHRGLRQQDERAFVLCHGDLQHLAERHVALALALAAAWQAGRRRRCQDLLRKTPLFISVFSCSFRACLGKTIVFLHAKVHNNNQKKALFAPSLGPCS